MAVTVKRYLRVFLRLLWEEIRERCRGKFSLALEEVFGITAFLGGLAVVLILTSLLLEGSLRLTLGWGFDNKIDALTMSFMFWVMTGVLIWFTFSIKGWLKTLVWYFKVMSQKAREECEAPMK